MQEQKQQAITHRQKPIYHICEKKQHNAAEYKRVIRIHPTRYKHHKRKGCKHRKQAIENAICFACAWYVFCCGLCHESSVPCVALALYGFRVLQFQLEERIHEAIHIHRFSG